MIKLIAFDLDGTILTDDGALTEYTKSELTRLMQRGTIIVPCSARPLKAFPDWFKQQPEIPYLICFNGAEIVDNTTKEIIKNYKLSGEKALEVTNYLQAKTDLFTYNIDNHMYSTMAVYDYLRPADTPFKKSMFSYYNRYYLPHYERFLEHIDNIGKIHICVDSDEEREALLEYAKAIPHVSITSSHPQNIEVLHELASKGSALKTLMEILDIKPDEAIAYGDNENDISLMQVVEHTVAMKNATDRLKLATHYTTEKDNNEDGVVRSVIELLETLNI